MLTNKFLSPGGKRKEWQKQLELDGDFQRMTFLLHYQCQKNNSKKKKKLSKGIKFDFVKLPYLGDYTSNFYPKTLY